MPAMTTETQILETFRSKSDHLQPNNEKERQSPKISLYEQSREERIKENLQRMQQLGLKDLSNSLLNSSSSSTSSRRGRPRRASEPPVSPLPTPLPPSAAAPLRRSSRLQNATAVTYSEVVLAKKVELLEDVELKLKQSEVYTEEHEKLLGHTERSWTLFVDGYGSDGRRIYDPVKGKTCHQCRQKTLGHRTHCSKCNLVQGQFCGDCLYMRYGEHVVEANENPNWVCPVCRGICNCSLCRQAKGWAPTGTLYRKISQMGFKSVAHYLIKTRHVQTNTEKNPDSIDQVSAKRSLSFPALEQPSQQSSEVDNQPVTPNPHSGEDGVKSEKKEDNANPEPNPTIIHENSARKSLLFPNSGPECEKAEPEEMNGNQRFSELESVNKRDDGLKCEHEKELRLVGKELNSSPMAFDCCTAPGKNHEVIIEPSPDSIGGLRQRSEKDNGHSDATTGVKDKVLDDKQREMQDAHDTEGEGHIAKESTPKLKKRPPSALEHNADSIAERMKRRQRS